MATPEADIIGVPISRSIALQRDEIGRKLNVYFSVSFHTTRHSRNLHTIIYRIVSLPRMTALIVMLH